MRTGTLERTVGVKKVDGTVVMIPEGTKAFATNITSARWNGLNPIEWCFVMPHGTDGKKSKAETVCISWQDKVRARYHTDVDSGLFLLPRASAVAQIQESWKLVPGTNKKGQPMEKWTRIVVTFKPEETPKQPPTPATE